MINLSKVSAESIYKGKDNVVTESFQAYITRMKLTTISTKVPARVGDEYVEEINGTEHIRKHDATSIVNAFVEVFKYGVHLDIKSNTEVDANGKAVVYPIDKLVLANCIDALALQNGIDHKVRVTLRTTTITAPLTTAYIDPITKLPHVHPIGTEFTDIVEINGIRDTKVYTIAE